MLPNRRAFLKATASTLALGALPVAARPADVRPGQPNILLILADDLGYGDLSCMGARDIQTPHIDALMNAGMCFENGYANSPVCSPTRAALLSGRYPDFAGVPGVIRTHRENSWGHLRPDMDLLPAVLRRGGYHTALIGKWHLGLESPNTPNERGFDLFHGFLGDMMDDYYTHRRHGINYLRHNGDVIEADGHATDLFTQWSVDYIQKQQTEEAPFFLYLAYNAPHSPIEPPADWQQKVQSRDPALPEQRAKLAALIEHMDDGIGRVVQALKDTGQYEQTLIIFCSDNGGDLRVAATSGALNGGKQDMFEGGIRSPLSVSWPEKITAGQRVAAPAMTMDLYPTLCTLAGLPYDRNVDGVNLLPLWLGEGDVDPERTMIWVRREGGPHGGQAYYAIRRGPWKLLQNHPFEPPRLYNLSEDPGETTPLPEDHGMHQQLFAALRDHINRAGAVPWQPKD
jgi:arylsulfatase A-like enzyme